MSIPWGELMKYRGHPEVSGIYDHPTFTDERVMIGSIIMKMTNILDFGCGRGKIYNEVLLPTGYKGEYVGIDPDPSLKNIVNFPLYENVEEFLKAGYNLRHFDMLLMMNVVEHLTVEEMYETVLKLNPYIDGNIVILTPNPKCFDYMFVDPQHKTFYSHEYLYGFCKHFGFDHINIWRGQGYHMIRDNVFKQNPSQTHLKEMNELQKRVCLAMGLDWLGNLLIIAEREYEEDTVT